VKYRDYAEWEQTVPESIKGDALWRMEVYRLALFLADLAWYDITKLTQDRRTLDLSGQLYEAVGSISANFSEGYSRSSARDQARFYEYSLGSARESRGWYYDARHLLGEAVTAHRLDLTTRIIKLLLTIIPAQRSKVLQEDEIAYIANPVYAFTPIPYSEST
jgi:four helix bundle protein